MTTPGARRPARPTPKALAESLSQRLNITELETRMLAAAIAEDRREADEELARVTEERETYRRAWVRIEDAARAELAEVAELVRAWDALTPESPGNFKATYDLSEWLARHDATHPSKTGTPEDRQVDAEAHRCRMDCGRACAGNCGCVCHGTSTAGGE
jgi:hypothetical protein